MQKIQKPIDQPWNCDGIAAESGVHYSKSRAACRRFAECRALLGGVFDGIDVLLTPCVQGEAPAGLGFTGDPTMQAMWTALHTPSMTLPTHRGPHKLPVGIQLVAQRCEDDRLLASARWIWQKIGDAELIGCRP